MSKEKIIGGLNEGNMWHVEINREMEGPKYKRNKEKKN